jgi:hypothetical protein
MPPTLDAGSPRAEPFDSLAAMQAAQTALTETVGADVLDPENVRRIRDFVARGRATGSLLDTREERMQAQSLLNYWAGRLSTAIRAARQGDSPGANLPAGGDEAQPIRFEDALLEEFDQTSVRTAAEAAGRRYGGLSAADQALARRVLLRLVTLSPEGQTFTPTPVPRAELEALGPAQTVKQILTELEQAGVIRVLPGEPPAGDRFALRSEALTREWVPYAEWLNKRLSFRGTVRYWKEHRDARDDHEALIRGDLLREAERYHDPNQDERLFIVASRDWERDTARRDRVWMWVFLSVAILALVATVAAVTALARKRKAEAQARDNAHALDVKLRVSLMVAVTRATAEMGSFSKPAERLLANNRLRILQQEMLESAPELRAVLGPHEKALALATLPEPSAVQLEQVDRAALSIGRAFHDQVSAPQNPQHANFDLEISSRRGVAYGSVKFCADQIIQFLRTRPYVDAAPLIREFWLYYWGEIGLVEGPRVAQAMVRFGGLLRLLDKHVAQEHASAIRGIFGEKAAGNAGQQLACAIVTQRTREGCDPADLQEFNRVKAAAVDVDALETNYKDSLLPALDAELGERPASNKPGEVRTGRAVGSRGSAAPATRLPENLDYAEFPTRCSLRSFVRSFVDGAAVKAMLLPSGDH